MSNDTTLATARDPKVKLVVWLRHWATCFHFPLGSDCAKAANRIEQLEGLLRRANESLWAVAQGGTDDGADLTPYGALADEIDQVLKE